MKISDQNGYFHLTYCTNIHAGDGWREVFSNLKKYAPELKRRLSPQAPFGIGLRLSSQESEQLLEGDHLQEFKQFLDTEALYVFTLNGFPYGSFHRQRVKSAVFAPDWRAEERLSYTLRLIEILAYLLPEGVEGGISTSPLSYKPWFAEYDDEGWRIMTRNIARVAETLVTLKDERRKIIHLDIEPEPDGLVENSNEVVDFYKSCIFHNAAPQLARRLAISRERAVERLLDHVQICLDTCHMAVEYESPANVLARFHNAGIKVGKIQISSALKLMLPHDRSAREAIARQLQAFAESTYLHQVVEQRRDGSLRHYTDLPYALTKIYEPQATQWRIHFHVPLFIDHYGQFRSTQDEIHTVFDYLKRTHFSRHLEIETYTWEVLPAAYKSELVDSIEREYHWVLDSLAQAAVPAVARGGH